jgi:hypothetical protein
MDFPGQDSPQPIDQFVGVLALHDVAVSTGRQRFENVITGIRCAQYDDLGTGAEEANSCNVLRAFQPGHAQVKDRERHVLIIEVVEHLGEAFSLEKSLYFQGPAKKVHEADAEDLMIVGDQNRPSKLGLASPHGFASPPCNSRGGHYAPFCGDATRPRSGALTALPKVSA